MTLSQTPSELTIEVIFKDGSTMCHFPDSIWVINSGVVWVNTGYTRHPGSDAYYVKGDLKGGGPKGGGPWSLDGKLGLFIRKRTGSEQRLVSKWKSPGREAAKEYLLEEIPKLEEELAQCPM